MGFSMDDLKWLREVTGCGVMECKKALAESKGGREKAKKILEESGLQKAAKKAGRAANEGRIESYVHTGNKLAVLVEINCETDFVAKNADFCQFSKDVAMHIAAMAPKYIKKENIPAEQLAEAQDKEEFIKEHCLMNQPFVKDSSKTIQDYLNSIIAKIGENILISRFIRYKVGQIE